MIRRSFSSREFLRKTVAAQIHLLGFVFGFVGLILLTHFAWAKPGYAHFFACLIFGMTSLFVFGTSTVYHFMNDGYSISKKLENRMENLDHFAIFLFIAGCYTPFVLNVIAPPWDAILLWFVWLFGFSGILYTHFGPRLPVWARNRAVYTSVFLLMGWLFLFRIGEAFNFLDATGILLFTGGGVSYTIGAIIYALRKPNPFPGIFGFHEIWHAMVLLGFAFHYILIFRFY